MERWGGREHATAEGISFTETEEACVCKCVCVSVCVCVDRKMERSLLYDGETHDNKRTGGRTAGQDTVHCLSVNSTDRTQTHTGS